MHEVLEQTVRKMGERFGEWSDHILCSIPIHLHPKLESQYVKTLLEAVSNLYDRITNDVEPYDYQTEWGDSVESAVKDLAETQGLQLSSYRAIYKFNTKVVSDRQIYFWSKNECEGFEPYDEDEGVEYRSIRGKDYLSPQIVSKIESMTIEEDTATSDPTSQGRRTLDNSSTTSHSNYSDELVGYDALLNFISGSDLSEEELRAWNKHRSMEVRRAVAEKPNCPADVLEDLANSGSVQILNEIFEHPNASVGVFNALARHYGSGPNYRMMMLQRDDIPDEVYNTIWSEEIFIQEEFFDAFRNESFQDLEISNNAKRSLLLFDPKRLPGYKELLTPDDYFSSYDNYIVYLALLDYVLATVELTPDEREVIRERIKCMYPDKLEYLEWAVPYRTP